ncbi:(-)-isopiperitenol/(-)-carveol dehydrogenase, mitochondrial [Sesamum alatum]|uniref:(-)-isopiperitenol/(-)-carveol dehydrogenase, mitochondrial n=1 Tax=Sesamum alatum TaxID=300844 RepID=A0AAE2CWX3_9LAMI|nr:(-)-isopiperitenol/(-)-carveol dehydrogenase, mitochondrial [Sesamum alatum]
MADTPSISLKKKLEGKVAIVTGGASGIGEATARLFAEHGARAVVIADVQAEKGKSVVESIGSQRSSYYQCDVADEEQVKSMVEWTVKTYGGLDIMFSNAGILGSSDQTILDLDLSQYDAVMRVNARGMAVCVKQAARKMTELGTKGAIVLHQQCRGGGGRTDVHRLHDVEACGVGAEIGLTTAGDVENLFRPSTSLKGVALTAELVAEAVLFLASDDSAFITGHNLVVDGGLISIPFLKPVNPS